MDAMVDLTMEHDSLRPLMFSIAYHMLGSVADAEDVVQEAFLKIHKSAADDVVVDSPDAFATTITTRVAIDALRSARRRREVYAGPWLPEPLLDDVDDPAHQVEMDESVSIAFLVVLERLSPLERAVFLLRDVFAYDYAEIAAVVEKTEANCRQVMSRARQHLKEARVRSDPSPQQRAELSERFFAAIEQGDAAGLEQLLAQDVTFYGDGGGKAPAIRTPMVGALPVARFLVGLGRQGARAGMAIQRVLVNGQPGARITAANGDLVGVIAIEIVHGTVVAVHNQINPDKLAHLGPVGDLTGVLAAVGQRPPAS